MEKLQPEDKDFLSIIADVGTWFAAVPATINHFSDQVRIRLIS